MGKYPLPPVFDHRYYASRNPNVANLSFEDACRHFLTIGKKRGCLGSPIADHRLFIAWIAGLGCERILEIGPGVNPSFNGDNVFYFDVREGDEFHNYARGKGVEDMQSLPSIDYYAEDGSLRGIDKKFDLIFSSHCIEHVCDIVTHINEVEHILEDDGIYCLVVPDKRYCFDHFRRTSSIGDIVDRHFATDTKYHPLQVFIDGLFMAHNDSGRHWRRDHGEANIDAGAIPAAIDRWKASNGRDPGMHAWTFTDDSFLQIFNLLYVSGMTRLKPVRVYNTPKDTFSFCAILQREPSAMQGENR
ncbi:methyltransferase domain-containing protein [Desulfovibrio sp. Huiquan2017]|uniref:methyltransferase domain-containing protein n=1 Tax=Desulfovibrio sp. Huiquan2017 TaxID=2816861 RepID=UPI001A933316|nr:methyltransferase domain-containing protein [Desulfovibrio sp. Huiquan2017]